MFNLDLWIKRYDLKHFAKRINNGKGVEVMVAVGIELRSQSHGWKSKIPPTGPAACLL